MLITKVAALKRHKKCVYIGGSTWGHIYETAKYDDQNFPRCIDFLLLTDLELNVHISPSGTWRNND
jgi:hypothetical protein